MNRITNSQLNYLVARINAATESPTEPYTYNEADKRYYANIGNFHISGAYGGVCLHKMVTKGGGITDVFSCGYIPKRELYNRMTAFLTALEEGY